jgi:hypothetical protein
MIEKWQLYLFGEFRTRLGFRVLLHCSVDYYPNPGFWRDREPSWRHLEMDGPVMVLDVGRGEFPVPDGPSYTIQPGDPPEALANFLTSLAWPPQ